MFYRRQKEHLQFLQNQKEIRKTRIGSTRSTKTKIRTRTRTRSIRSTNIVAKIEARIKTKIKKKRRIKVDITIQEVTTWNITRFLSVPIISFSSRILFCCYDWIMLSCFYLFLHWYLVIETEARGKRRFHRHSQAQEKQGKVDCIPIWVILVSFICCPFWLRDVNLWNFSIRTLRSLQWVEKCCKLIKADKNYFFLCLTIKHSSSGGFFKDHVLESKSCEVCLLLLYFLVICWLSYLLILLGNVVSNADLIHDAINWM